jgi:hypothetical protein
MHPIPTESKFDTLPTRRGAALLLEVLRSEGVRFVFDSIFMMQSSKTGLLLIKPSRGS